MVADLISICPYTAHLSSGSKLRQVSAIAFGQRPRGSGER